MSVAAPRIFDDNNRTARCGNSGLTEQETNRHRVVRKIGRVTSPILHSPLVPVNRRFVT